MSVRPRVGSVLGGVFRNPELPPRFLASVASHPGVAVEAKRLIAERLPLPQATIAP